MDWQLDEWCKRGYAPQQDGTITLVDANGVEHVGSLGFDIDDDTGEWRWYLVDASLGITRFDEDDIESTDDGQAYIVLKRRSA